MYYNLSKALSYDAFINILLGERGVGKTYSLTKFVIKEFIKKNHEFMYIRRYKTELQKAVPKFFTPMIVNEEFKGHKLEVKNNSFYIDGKIAGYTMTLSTAQNLKSTNFPKVKYIIFDEFLIEDGQNHYLKNEINIFLGAIETIARMRDVKVFLLGNSVSITNPYFLYFDLHLPYGNNIKTFKDGLILVEYMENLKYREEKRKTKFGKLIENTEFGDYAINNKMIMDDSSFIMKKTGGAKCNFVLTFNENIYGVWYDYNEGKIFISNDYVNNVSVFACTTKDHKPNTMLISMMKEYHLFKVFVKNYKLGNIYYESQKIKNNMKEIIKLLAVR